MFPPQLQNSASTGASRCGLPSAYGHTNGVSGLSAAGGWKPSLILEGDGKRQTLVLCFERCLLVSCFVSEINHARSPSEKNHHRVVLAGVFGAADRHWLHSSGF